MLIKRSFTLAGHRTSVALEAEFWEALAALAARAGLPLATFVARHDAARTPGASLASVLRVAALRGAAESRRGTTLFA